MKKVLVAEDDEALGSILKIKLKDAGYEMILAVDGQEAIEKVSTEKPDLILLDLLMPKKDGYQVLQELKASADWKNIPVLVTSNLSRPIEIDRIKQLGALDYVIKSNESLDQLVNKIKDVAK
tara:strand:+ start:110 stop:475 length:366 start_codon:yes stop_codon:yes gene_type:complete